LGTAEILLVEIRGAENQVVIFDAGTRIRNLGEALFAEFEGRPLNLTYS
jgi:hypothetical protein